ncbi:MAG: aldo/keto reductase [Eubacteriaceae bacterium]|jgi:predicted aldo/keto reductase-like oxidoreductase|nr:aldo/keto reductase [Eubacteriaceae bacterium]
MNYRKDPKNGNELSILGFGGMRLPSSGLGIDQQKTNALISKAISLGINYIDTAYIYSGSEAAIGVALKECNGRDKVYLATKLPHRMCRDKASFGSYFEKSLTRLQTGYIDYYLIHNLQDLKSWERLVGLGILDWISEKKKNGQISNIGFSFHGRYEAFIEIIDSYSWDFCQIQYNYMNENYQAGKAGLQAASSKGMAVMVMEPLLGGKLANSLPKQAQKAFSSYSISMSPAEWAFRWIWDQAEATVTLSGMNSLAQLEENTKAASKAHAGMLTEKERSIYKEAVEAVSESYKVPCTGCGYCMPCPNGVNIPDCFSSLNTSYSIGYIAGLAGYVTAFKTNNPRNCKKCGLCEKSCPQAIPIQESLKLVARRMEPAPIRLAMKAAGWLRLT